jgi:hypothetical protein
MKECLLFLALLLCTFALWAQNLLSEYNFSYAQNGYMEITDATTLGTLTTDNQSFVDPVMLNGSTFHTQGPGFPIGFDFYFAGEFYDRVGINANGWIALGQSVYGNEAVNMMSANYSFPLASEVADHPHEALIARIAGFARDLQAQDQSSIKIGQSGTPPSRELIVQWKNYRSSGATGDSYNFQIRLREQGMRVSVIYQSMQAGSTAAGEVGLRTAPAASALNFATRTTAQGWADSQAGIAASSRATLSSTIFPTTGATFTWSPSLVSAPTADFGAEPLSGPAPLLVQFTDLSSPGDYPITSWNWDFGGQSSPEQHPLFCFNNPGLYTVSLVVSDALGSSSTETKYQYINVLPSDVPGLNTYIQMQGNDAAISWDPITVDEAGNSFTPDYYFVYFNGSNDISAEFYFLAPVPYPDTSYIHSGVGLGAERMMYRVQAVQLE